MLSPLPWLLVSCGSQAPAPPPFALAAHPEAIVALELPAGNRPGGQPVPDTVPLQGPFELTWEQNDLAEYQHPMPVGQVFYGHNSRSAPPDMQLLDAQGRVLVYSEKRNKNHTKTTWRALRGRLWVRPAKGEPAPEPGQLQLRYPPATAWENELNVSSSQLEGTAFVTRLMKLENDAWQGVYLPAPAESVWQVDVPPAGVLDFDARLLSSAVPSAERSDGASLAVEVRTSEGTRRVAELSLDAEQWRHERVDLSDWAGQRVQLSLATDPGESPLFDYVFLANPAVFSPRDHPRRLLLVFIDTLRLDHVGLYGYQRDTTPFLDRWSEGAVVFEQARSTSSWTLPAARTAFSGDPPALWHQRPNLPQRLEQAGFVTGAFVSNAYMTDGFDMGVDWSEHRYKLIEPAEEQVEKAERFFKRHADRDAAVVVQFMDPHLPYLEPESHASLWAGAEPPALAGYRGRKELRKIGRRKSTDLERVKRYLLARYDQNIRYVDDQLQQLFDAAGPRAVVGVFADHGEEFWDHGEVEHGHSFYEELVRVPMLVGAPGLQPGRVATPVSLMDLTPTLLDLLGLPAQGMTGRSLLPLARGDAGQEEAFSGRPQFFGDMLYGPDAWGVADRGHKWISSSASQSLYDLQADPQEQRDLAIEPGRDLSPYPRALSRALGREAVTVWLLTGFGSGEAASFKRGSVTASHPAGFLRAWHPFAMFGDHAEPRIEDGRATVERSEDALIPREIFLQPAGDPMDPRGLCLHIEREGKSWDGCYEPETLPPLGPRNGESPEFLQVGQGHARFRVALHVAPLPAEQELPGSSTRVEEELRLLGYTD